MKDVSARIAGVALVALWIWGCSGEPPVNRAEIADPAIQASVSQPRPSSEALPPEAEPVQASTPQATSAPEPSSPPSSALPPKPAIPDAPKPVVIAVAGADGHGKTTLLSAMSHALSKRGKGSPRSYDALTKGSGAEISFDSGTRRIILREYPSHEALVAALGRQDSRLEGFILVVAQAHGITRQTRDQIVAAGQGHQRLLAVVQTKDDLVDDAELKDLEQSEIEQACVDNGLLAEADAGTWVEGKYKPGTRLPFVRVSAELALQKDAEAEANIAKLTELITRKARGTTPH